MIITQRRLRELVMAGHVRNRNREVVVDASSICIHLDNVFTQYEPYDGEPFTPPREMPATSRTIGKDDHIVLPPGGRLLACSEEEVRVPNDKFGLVQTKGSIARGFLFVHVGDGQVDPGYRGKITLELFNASGFYYKLVPGMPIGSLFVFQTDEPVDAYDGRYQNAGAPTVMRTMSKSTSLDRSGGT